MASPVARKDAEYQYYTKKLSGASISVPATTPLNEMRKVWHAHIVNPGNTLKTALDLEWNWLGTFSGVTGTTIRDRWEQAFVAVAGGLKVPSDLEELQAMFYQLAP